MRFLLIITIALLLSSCKQEKTTLEIILTQSQNNRSELEKVLNHYKDDTLKYKATVFLIENMPYYSYEISSEIDSVKIILENTFNRWNITEKELQKGISLLKKNSPIIKYDLREITSDLLIENIDLSFNVWKKPWNKNLKFEDFCELILPYRIADEPLTQWRKKYYDKYNPILDSLYRGTDVVKACNILSDYMKTEKFFYFTGFGTPRQGAQFQLENRIGTCRDACDIATYVMRSVGIPVTTDMYPYSPEYQMGHEWNVVRDTTGRYLPFWYEQFNAVRDDSFTDKRKKGKVYRMTYGLQHPIKSLKKLPISLQKPFMKDVTNEYFGKNEVIIPFKDNIENVFIGVFTARNGWLPVGRGKIENKSIVFENIEPFVVYQPLTYKNNELIPITHPFMYKKNKVHIFTPENKAQEVILTRKYPLRKSSTARYKNWLLLTEIRGSNHPHFLSSNLIHKITELPSRNIIEININNSRSYSNFQYQVPKDSVLSIAEIHFFNENNKEIIFDTIYSNGKPWKNIALYQLKNCNDNDPVSFFHTWEKGTSIFFRSKKPQKIKRVQLIPRNDDNFIRVNEVYELFYNDGKNGWVSLGEQIGTKEEVLNYRAPKNAILWLKNKTKGKEEQIFTYENNRQIFPTFEEYGK